MAARFPICLPYTLAQECPLPDDWSNPKNFSNDAHDPGGKTMCGIIQREYDAYRKRKNEGVQSVRLITRDEGLDIYEDSYWLPYCPQMPAGLDLQFFDSSVNEGTHEAVKILQVALGVTSDGAWGPLTAAAVGAVKNPIVTVQAFTARRSAVYRQMRGFIYFGHGWETRAAEIGAHALKMAALA